MGLDMYIQDEEGNELIYWRKEPAIHQWFNDLADRKGIEYDSFNCVKVPLSEDNIDELIQDIHHGNLKWEASGFFFGPNSEDSDSLIWRAHQILALSSILPIDQPIYYNSWW